MACALFSILLLQTAALAVVYRASAVEQPDTVGPAGVFEDSVKTAMTDEGVTRDVAEMLVAARTIRPDDGDAAAAATVGKLCNALRFMDEVQRNTAVLYDATYDDFLDLYPNWRAYLLTDDPAKKDRAYRDYRSLLDRYTEGQKNLIQGLGFLVALQKALLPSNVYADPDRRIVAMDETVAVLDDF